MIDNKHFTILDSTESTNNYAMRLAYAGLATHGQAWFANEQWGGRGQRGKQWHSAVGENIILTIAIQPNAAFTMQPFNLNAFVAVVCRQFFADKTNDQTTIKWPNDIFFGDNKAGGILIENIFSGKIWKWAIIGIGINVNQTTFNAVNNNPTSLKLINKKHYDVQGLALELYHLFIDKYNTFVQNNATTFLNDYQLYLYKKNEKVTLNKHNAVFETTIIGVSNNGQLLTYDVMERAFEFGEVEWVFK